MRDGIFLFLEAVTFFYENAQHLRKKLRKCYATLGCLFPLCSGYYVVKNANLLDP